jgi:hypothetical protein
LLSQRALLTGSNPRRTLEYMTGSRVPGRKSSKSGIVGCDETGCREVAFVTNGKTPNCPVHGKPMKAAIINTQGNG